MEPGKNKCFTSAKYLSLMKQTKEYSLQSYSGKINEV